MSNWTPTDYVTVGFATGYSIRYLARIFLGWRADRQRFYPPPTFTKYFAKQFINA